MQLPEGAQAAMRRIGQASRLFDAGLVGQALAEAQSLVEESRRKGDLFGEAIASGFSGQCCIALARLTEALRYLLTAESLASQLALAERRFLEPMIRGTLGNAYRDLGLPEKALECYVDVVRLMEGTGGPQLRLKMHLDAARTHLCAGQPDLAVRQVKKAEDLAQDRTMVSPMDRSHIEMMRCLVQLEGYLLHDPPREPEWKKLIKSLRGYAGGSAPVLMHLGNLVDKLWGRPQRTVARYLEVVWRRSTASQDLPAHITSHTLMAACSTKVWGNLGKGVDLYAKAASIIYRFLDGIDEPEYRCSFLRQNWRTIDHYVTALLRLNRIEEALQLVERMQHNLRIEGHQPGVNTHGVPDLLEAAMSRIRAAQDGLRLPDRSGSSGGPQ